MGRPWVQFRVKKRRKKGREAGSEGEGRKELSVGDGPCLFPPDPSALPVSRSAVLGP